MSFIEQLEKSTNSTTTENGAKTNISTLDPVLDFFSLAGAMRANPDGAVQLFKKALAADKQAAIRCLFYLRDIRGGQGERDIFKKCFWSISDGKIQGNLLRYIPEYGRWDEILDLTNPVTYPIAVEIIRNQLEQDEKAMADGKSVSLLAKWLPSENATSKIAYKQAVALMKNLELKPHQYRKKVVALRKYIKLLEQKMSAKEWDSVDYEKIPSQAHRKHVKAFKRNDEARYSKFLEAVEKGEKKINASTLFTYEVYNMVRDSKSVQSANALWKSLPDYTNGENALVLADTSGSMEGSYGSNVAPISVSVSLALYFAERNKGAFKDFFMTFDLRPRLVKISGATLSEKFDSIGSASQAWGNTNLEAAFQTILEAAKIDSTPQSELPKVLYIISDMEFDQCVNGSSETNFDNAKTMFSNAGYELPHVVFWNVSARNEQSPATKYDNGVTLISGSNQSTFQYAVAGKTPLESMNDILNSERYAQIVI